VALLSGLENSSTQAERIVQEKPLGGNQKVRPMCPFSPYLAILSP